MTTSPRTGNLEAQEQDRFRLLSIHNTYASLEDYEAEQAYLWEVRQGHCSICDGLGHGFPGGGPCPLETRGEQGVPAWAM